MARVNSPLVLHDLSDINMTLRAHRWFNCEKVCVACLFVGVCVYVRVCMSVDDSEFVSLSVCVRACVCACVGFSCVFVRVCMCVCVSVFQNPSLHAL